MLTLGNIVLLSQLRPVWDGDQNLGAADFPSFGTCIRLWVPSLPTHSPTFSPHMGGLTPGTRGSVGVGVHQLFACSWAPAARRRVLPAVLLGGAGGWIQAEGLEGNEGWRRTWGRAPLGLQGLGR